MSPDGATRVLFTADAVGGVWQYSLDLARGFAARGMAPLLAVLGPPPSPSQRAAAGAITGLRLLVTGLPLDWTADCASDVRGAADALAALASREGVQSAHLHAPALAAAAWPVPVVAVAHSCVATWWRAVRGGPLPPDFRWRRDFSAEGLRAADAVIAATRSFADALLAEYGGALSIHVVHNGRADPDVAAQPRERAVLTAGRLWDAGKNVAVLDAAAGRLDAPVHAAGPLAFAGERIAFRHLHHLGVLNEDALRRRMAATAVFASPARYEPFGLAVLEAAQCGAGLVLSDIPSFRELWDGAARFVPADDADALAAALREALDRPADCAAWARARAARYRLEAMVQGTLAVHRAVGTKRPRAALELSAGS